MERERQALHMSEEKRNLAGAARLTALLLCYPLVKVGESG
jgi:hypothetical protein